MEEKSRIDREEDRKQESEGTKEVLMIAYFEIFVTCNYKMKWHRK
jgi:hypothetical protein